MALTRVTSQVLDSNAVSSAKLANNAITSRNLSNLTIELRHLAPSANVAALHADLSGNVNTLQANLNTTTGNINIVQGNVAAAEANAASATGNTIRLFANVQSNVLAVTSNTVQLLANLNQTSTNVAGIISGSTPFTGQVTMNDDLIITGNLIINGDTTTANSINMIVEDRMMMLANSVSGSPSADVGMLFNRGNQGNAAFFYDESAKSFAVADTKDPSSNTTLSPVTLGNLAVGTLKFNGADLATAIADNRSGAVSTVFATNLTASRALSSDSSGKIAVATTTLAELNHVNGVTGGIQTQLDTKDTVANVFATFVRLNANINVLQDNVNTVQGNVTNSIILEPFMNVNTATGTSNVFFTGKNITTDDNVMTVTLDGVVQSNLEFVYHHSNDTIQFKDASIPAGVIVTIFTLT